MTEYLRVRLGDRWLGLRVDQVVEVVEEFERLDAPGSHPAVMGVTPIKQRVVPLVQLAALIEDDAASDTSHGMVVLARCSGAMVAFVVDDAEELVREDPRPVPETWQLPWASGVVQHEGELIPIVDLEVLAERLVAGGAELGNEHRR